MPVRRRHGNYQRAIPPAQTATPSGAATSEDRRSQVEALLGQIAPYLVQGADTATADRDLYDDGLPR